MQMTDHTIFLQGCKQVKYQANENVYLLKQSPLPLLAPFRACKMPTKYGIYCLKMLVLILLLLAQRKWPCYKRG